MKCRETEVINFLRSSLPPRLKISTHIGSFDEVTLVIDSGRSIRVSIRWCFPPLPPFYPTLFFHPLLQQRRKKWDNRSSERNLFVSALVAPLLFYCSGHSRLRPEGVPFLRSGGAKSPRDELTARPRNVKVVSDVCVYKRPSETNWTTLSRYVRNLRCDFVCICTYISVPISGTKDKRWVLDCFCVLWSVIVVVIKSWRWDWAKCRADNGQGN